MKKQPNISTTPSSPFFFFSLVLLLIQFPSYSSTFNTTNWYTSCNNTFNCGEITGVDYPFWGGDRPKECGHPDLHLNCNNTLAATITIFKLDYRVLQIDQPNQILTIKRNDLSVGDICPAELISTTIESSLFEYASNYVNLTIQYGCPFLDIPIPLLVPQQLTCTINGTDYQNNCILPGSQGPGQCRASIVIPVQSVSFTGIGEFSDIGKLIEGGFDVRWKVTRTECDKCKSTGGRCGFNLKSNQFVCVCPESDQPPEGYGGSCSGSNLLVNSVSGPPSYQLSPISEMVSGIERREAQKAAAKAARKAALSETSPTPLPTVNIQRAVSEAGSSRARSPVTSPTVMSAGPPQRQRRRQEETSSVATEMQPPPKKTRNSQTEAGEAEIPEAGADDVVIIGGSESADFGARSPRGFSGQAALFTSKEFLANPSAEGWNRKMSDSLADVVPLHGMAREWTGPARYAVGEGILRRVADPTRVTGRSGVGGTLAHLVGDFGIAQSALSARLLSLVQAYSEQENTSQRIIEKLQSQLKSSEEAKIEAVLAATKLSTEGEVLKTELASLKKENKGQKETLKRLREERKAAQESATDHALKLQTETAEREAAESRAAEAEKKVAELEAQLADSHATFLAKLPGSDAFYDIAEEAFDQGFYHALRCVRRATDKGRLGDCLEMMADWPSTNIFDPTLRVYHPELPYTEKEIKDHNEKLGSQGLEIWVPPPVIEHNLRSLQKRVEAGEEIGDLQVADYDQPIEGAIE